ncbi:hypothetical protein CASFOL_012106 [Castilleja foliolosa]|uniref:Uncharacterized protein n=1 Tax=Castilleja foliolosa TaxID=1961234 RepID=A0ABD3DQN3_9LAMI
MEEMDCFTVSRLSVDEEFMVEFKHRFKPHLCPTPEEYAALAAGQKREASTIPWNLDDKWLENAKKWVQEEPKPDDKLMTEASESNIFASLYLKLSIKSSIFPAQKNQGRIVGQASLTRISFSRGSNGAILVVIELF